METVKHSILVQLHKQDEVLEVWIIFSFYFIHIQPVKHNPVWSKIHQAGPKFRDEVLPYLGCGSLT